MSILQSISSAVRPWHDFYAHSKATSSGVTWVHLSALVVGGGLAISSDRIALRLRSAPIGDRQRMLHDFSTVHRPIVIALTVSVLSGAAMLLSDVDTFLVSPVYWTKMGLVVLLLANGYGVMRTEQALGRDPSPDNRLWARFTFGAVASIALWLGTTLAGVLLVNA